MKIENLTQLWLGVTADRQIAVILAFFTGLAVLVLSVAEAVALIDRNNQVPQAMASLLTTTFGALIGALATWLGTHRGDTIKKQE